VRSRESIEAHSGYYFRGSWADKLGLVFPDQAAHHDFHHAYRSSGNFGCEWLDLVHETQDAYVAIGFADGYMASSWRHQSQLRVGSDGLIVDPDEAARPAPLDGI
jgi:sterol desaturase/sphingolipid hydroxylase (fatty acid hydroxylase superfamily)